MRDLVGEWSGDRDPGDEAGEEEPDDVGDRENTEDGGEEEAEEDVDSVRSEGRLGRGGSLRGITLLPLIHSKSRLLLVVALYGSIAEPAVMVYVWCWGADGVVEG